MQAILLKLNAVLLARPKLNVFLYGLLIGALPTLLFGFPIPRTHDEFGYLLLADTFAQFRLTNPTPDSWLNFETIHVFMQPTYTAKFFPGPAVWMAFTQLLLGQPAASLWILSGLLHLAVFCVLSRFYTLRWTLFGLALVSISANFSYWSYSYWGGLFPALAGTLLLGGLMLLVRRQWQVLPWVVLGAFLLIFSRPFEGFVLGVGALLAAIFYHRDWLPSLRDSHILSSRAFALSVLIALLGTASFLIYNKAVTGSLFKVPYYLDPRNFVPFLLTMKLGPQPDFTLPNFKAYYGWELSLYELSRAPETYFEYFAQRLRSTFWHAAISYPLLLLIPLAWCSKRDNVVAMSLVPIAIYTGLLAILSFGQPHYLAPFFLGMIVLQVEGMKNLSEWIAERKVGWNNRLMALALLLMIVQGIWTFSRYFFYVNEDWAWRRDSVIKKMEETEQNHLILVTYLEGHNPHTEYVYNGASLKTQKVIWALSRGVEKDQNLLDAYPGRIVWDLSVGQEIKMKQRH